MNELVQTDFNVAMLIIRVALGVVIFAHGAQKLLGWFGGYGFKGTMGWFTGTVGVPAIFGFAAIMTEFFASLALIAGIFGRIAAGLIGFEMIVAAILVHRSHGFFMNWGGNQKGEGWEFHILAVAMAIAIILMGSGAYSVDLMLAR